MSGNFLKSVVSATLVCALAGPWVSGCSSSTGDSVNVQGNYAVVFAMRSNTVSGNPTDSVEFAAGGDLMMADLSSPSAPLVNLTSGYTQGKGDVSDPEISYDGTRVLFSMRGPNDPTFNIFEMDLSTRQMHRIISDDSVANLGDDVDPAYLPDGRIVFTSNRQTASQAQMALTNTTPYQYLDEYDRERSTVLHVMNADGSNIHQISMNQSHDRNPTVLSNGKIMFSRWDHLGARNHFPIFTVNPDGTGLFVEYGAFSPGNSFLHPREISPGGDIMSDLMPLNRTHEGGALMEINANDFVDDSEPVAPDITGNGQHELTLNQVDYNSNMGLAPYGRYTTPYPLKMYDGTNRALVSWTPSRPVTQINPATGAKEQVEGLPRYGVYMFDMDKKTLRPIAIPAEGWDYVDPVPVIARSQVPAIIPDQPVNTDLAAKGLAVINVKSVYDTDIHSLMGQSDLVPGESIPQTANPDPAHDIRSTVADIATIKDPAQTTAAQRPARFLRVFTAVPTPPGLSREAIGETEFEMQQLLGYATIQPDGSARIVVPADTPIGLSVVDSNGMAIQVHTNWLQLLPGETRTCNGCHSPRRGVSINESPLAGTNPNTNAALTSQPGETMAETWTRLNPSTVDGLSIPAAALTTDMNFVDVWTDPALAGRAPDPSLSLTYAGLTTPAPAVIDYPATGTPVFTFHYINYPDNIAPIISADRGSNTCTNCHNNTAGSIPPDLSNTVAGTGRLQSYEGLTLGTVQFDSNGFPIVNIEDNGEVMLARNQAMVNIGSSDESSRTSQLFEILLDKTLRSGVALPSPMTVNHAGMLDASELRILAEWADMGAQYYNDPFNGTPRSTANIRGVNGLDETAFDNDVHPILMDKCAGCHQAFQGTGSSAEPPNTDFSQNQFVLTGNLKGDYDVTLTMINNVCTPADNPLLLRPISTGGGSFPHPQVGTPPLPVLSITDTEYLTILNWIASGMSANHCTT